jgi:hypothetical protein
MGTQRFSLTHLTADDKTFNRKDRKVGAAVAKKV